MNMKRRLHKELANVGVCVSVIYNYIQYSIVLAVSSVEFSQVIFISAMPGAIITSTNGPIVLSLA